MLRNYLIHNEGWKPEVYEDTLKIPTVGVGFNLNRKDAAENLESIGADLDAVKAKTQSLKTEQILALLEQDMRSAVITAQEVFPRFYSFDDTRQTILVDLAFNLGSHRLRRFYKMIAAINSNPPDWDEAAAQLKNSRWFHQVGHRGPRNVDALKSGDMPHFHGGGVWSTR